MDGSAYVRDSIANQKLGSKDFGKIYESVMNGNKFTILSFNNDSNTPMASTSDEIA